MKQILYILLLTNTFSWAQEDKFFGIVKDAETLEPLPYVSIVFENNTTTFKNGSITNSIGEFSVSKNNANVSFSHINYETSTLTLNDSTSEILLIPKTYLLKELVITNVSARSYLRKMVNESNDKISNNTNFKSYCREIVKVNQKYTKFSDALIDYHVKKGNSKTILTLNQHRAFKSTSLDAKAKSEMTEYYEQSLNSVVNVKDYVKNAYSFENLQKILKSEDYEFEWWAKKEANGAEYECINVIPNPNCDKKLFQGYVIIDPQTKSIIEYKLHISEAHKKNSTFKNVLVLKFKMDENLVWSKFRNINGQNVLIYNKVYFDFVLFVNDKHNDTLTFTSDIYVYDFENNVELPKNGYNKKNIFEAGTNYTNEYWRDFNLFPLSKEEEDFIKSIR
jgi:hypothetical protein